MDIPPEAIEAAKKAISKWGGTPPHAAETFANDALEAALPFLEKSLREEIGEELMGMREDPDFGSYARIENVVLENAAVQITGKIKP